MNDEVRDERFPIWDALSEFFLDTDLDSSDYERISKVLSSSPYTIEELGDILYYEVYPVCKWNMLSVAGEWAGFDPAFICERMGRLKDRRPKNKIARYLKKIRTTHWMFFGHWSVVAKKIEEKRCAAGQPQNP